MRVPRVPAAVALALAVVTTAPYVAAALQPPGGAVFTGAFFYQDDMYQYFSFVEGTCRPDQVAVAPTDVSLISRASRRAGSRSGTARSPRSGGALLGGDGRAVRRVALPLLEIWQVSPRDLAPRPPGS